MAPRLNRKKFMESETARRAADQERQAQMAAALSARMDAEEESEEGELVFGAVRISIRGPECQFVVCERAEWDHLTEEQKKTTLIHAMWASGLIEVFVKDEENDQ